MCVRFALNRALEQLRANIRAHGIRTNGHNFQPSNNIAPTNPAPVVSQSTIQVFTFGIRNEARGNIICNARSETVSKVFSRDINARRCVIPADGYFEYDASKQPFFFHKKDNELLFFAGFYTEKGEFVILTRDASPKAKKIHERMPVIFTEKEIEQWESPKWAELLGISPAEVIFYPVSKYALRPGYYGAECIKKIDNGKRQLTMFDVFKEAKKEKPKEELKQILEPSYEEV